MEYELNFRIETEGEQLLAQKDTVRVLSCVFGDGILDFSVVYDFKEDQPLHLKAAVKAGDKIRVRILPYRIELYVNELLMDEEWPCGNHYLGQCTIVDKGCSFTMSPLEESRKEEPAVSAVFQGAEGWKPEENVFVGDCMPYCHEGVYHVLYLKERRHHKSKWGKGAHQWAHISTADFVNWEIHPMAVEIDDPDEGSICTGSWIYDKGMHYLYYTVRMCDERPSRISRSVSRDGFHFEKDKDFCFVLSGKYNGLSARDPKVIKDAGGRYHMFLTTTENKSKRGCLAHCVSEDLLHWRELDEPMYTAPADLGEPECPDYFYKDGYYYLVYSLQGKGYYQYSKKPFSDWKFPKEPQIPCKTVPKAAVWKDRLIFTGFDGKGRYAGTMTFLEAEVKENGILAFTQHVFA